MAIDAVQTVVYAKVGQQNLEQGNTAAIGGITVADAHAASGGANSFIAALGVPLNAATRRAGRIVFRGIGKNGQFLHQLHAEHLHNTGRIITYCDDNCI